MNEKTTHPKTISGQARAFEALADMGRTFPELPAGYGQVFMDGEDVLFRVNSADAFEAWRVALSIPPADVELKEHNGMRWLRAKGVWAGITIDLTSHSVVIPEGVPLEPAPAGLPSEWTAAVSA